MKVSGFMARQYAIPSGLFGRLFLGHMLNQANKKSNNLIFSQLDVKPDSKILEVGFGGGDLLRMIAEKTECNFIHGVEISEPMLIRMKAHIKRKNLENRIRLEKGAIDHLPHGDSHFDRVASVNTIYFWPNLGSGVTELARIMQEGGRLVLGTGTEKDLRKLGYEEQGFKLYSLENIIRVLERHGFNEIEVSTFQQKHRGPFNAIKAVMGKSS